MVSESADLFVRESSGLNVSLSGSKRVRELADLSVKESESKSVSRSDCQRVRGSES